MIPSEIIKKIRLIEIKTKHIVNNIFGGEYHSAFKGVGIEFSEVRQYYPGDDIKGIDWNVTARYGTPYIKKYNEERELTVILMIDVSASGFYGSGSMLKSDLMIEIGSILSFSAIKNNDKVGLLLFSDKIEKYIPATKGKSHALRVIREIIYHRADNTGSDIGSALNHLQKVLKRKSIIFILSDFWCNNYYKQMKRMNRKHDLINVQILDNTEINFPTMGLMKFHDVESKLSFWINTSNKNHIHKISERVDTNIKILNAFCKRNKIDLIRINEYDGYIDPLIKFFNSRTKK